VRAECDSHSVAERGSFHVRDLFSTGSERHDYRKRTTGHGSVIEEMRRSRMPNEVILSFGAALGTLSCERQAQERNSIKPSYCSCAGRHDGSIMRPAMRDRWSIPLYAFSKWR